MKPLPGLSETIRELQARRAELVDLIARIDTALEALAPLVDEPAGFEVFERPRPARKSKAREPTVHADGATVLGRERPVELYGRVDDHEAAALAAPSTQHVCLVCNRTVRVMYVGEVNADERAELRRQVAEAHQASEHPDLETELADACTHPGCREAVHSPQDRWCTSHLRQIIHGV